MTADTDIRNEANGNTGSAVSDNKGKGNGFLSVVPLLLLIYIAVTGTAILYKEYSTVPAAEASAENTIPIIGMEEFDQLKAEKKSFVILFARASCRQCAVVEYVLGRMDGFPIPVYIYDLERYYPGDEYDAIKASAGISYVPTFIYYECGKFKYCKNNPLPDGYFDENRTAEELRELRNKVRDNISAFMDGITGKGELVNEVPMSNVVIGVETGKNGG